LALSKSGRLIATGQTGKNADVIVWDFEQKSLIVRFSEHDHGIMSLGFSDDERLLVTVGVQDDKKMFVWDLQTGCIVATVAAPPGTKVASFGGMVRNVKRRDTDHYQLATAGLKQLMIWDLNPMTGEMVPTKVQTGSYVRDYTCLAWSPDCELMMAGTTSGDFAVVALKSRTLLCSVSACAGGVGAVCCVGPPNGGIEALLVGGGDGTVSVYKMNSQRQFEDTCTVQLEGAVSGLSASQDRVEALAGTRAGFVYRLRVNGLAALLVSENHSAKVTAVSYPFGVSERFATASDDRTLRIWDASDYKVITKAYVGDAGTPTSCVFSLDALISGWTDGKIRAHNAETGEFLWEIPNAHRGGVTSLVLSNNQRFIISGGEEGEVRVWELRSRELVSHLKEHGLRVTSLALFDDDVHALSCSRDRSFLCWDLRKEKRISNHTQRMGGINAIALSRDQTQVLTIGQEKKITYWDLRQPNPVQVIGTAHADEATCIAVSFSGQFFATGGTDQVVKLWDYATGNLIMDGVGHSGTVNGLHFSPDDRQLISVGSDGNIFVWNIYA
jgi:WD40 repeat protein